MTKINRTIDCKTGIYDSEYTLRMHKDGSITVRTPCIKWKNNTGILAYENIHITNKKRSAEIISMFTNNILCDKDGYTIKELLN